MQEVDTERDDALLIAAVAGGNEDALQRLYERYGGLTYTVALRITGDPQVAQEVVQDVFMRCWHRAGSFEPGRGRVHAWLIGITRNRSIDTLRGAQHHARERDVELPPGDYHAYASSGEGEVESVALQLSVADALQTLPEGQRRAIELVLSAGLTQREIADLLGLPLGTVKTRIRDGMARLRSQLLTGQSGKASR
jgi:RNA polymerase sigma-70 factor (ECF subfamily)